MIEIGASSRDIRHTAPITLDVEVPTPVLDKESTFEEWLQHPQGQGVLKSFLDDLGEAGAMWRDPETVKLLGSMPVRSLVSFAGYTDIDGTVGALLSSVAKA